MLRGLYTLGTGMLTQQRRLDVLSNNVANSETTGFKMDKLLSRSFNDVLISLQNDPSAAGTATENRTVGPLNYGIHVDEIITSFSQGAPLATDVDTDVAIIGNGFFSINTPDGVRFSRDGSFNRDNTGLLTDSFGNAVMGQNGNIIIENDEFSINALGDIFVDGELVDRLRVVSFNNEDLAQLRKLGNNLYDSQGAAEQEFTGQLKQGYLEASNVDLAHDMVSMIEMMRNFESNQRIFRMMDESLGKAVNDIARR